MAVVVHLTLTYTPEVKETLFELVHEASAVLKEQEGIQALALYNCPEKQTLYGIVHCEDREVFDGCQYNPEWFRFMPDWSTFMEDQTVQFEVRFCEAL